MVGSTFVDKHKQIIGEFKSKYWVCTDKFGAKIPKYVADAKSFDEDNGNTLCWDTLWWDTIFKEIKNVHPSFETWEEDTSELPPG